MKKPLVTIDDWSVVDDLIFHGYRELAAGQRLTGTIFGRENLPRGVTYTSVIRSVDPVEGTVETLNTTYQLGRVNEDYERWMLEQEEAQAGVRWDDARARFVPSRTERETAPALFDGHPLSYPSHQH